MRALFLSLAALAAIIFFYVSYRSLKGLFPVRESRFQMVSLVGFQSDDNVIPGLAELKKEFSTKITTYNEKADHIHRNWLWLSFLVTSLTAASALVSSIKAAKNDPQSSVRAMILIAVLTFLATLGTWGTSQENDLHTELLQKSAKVTTKRSDFYLEYQKAKDDNEKEAVVQKYKEDLDSL